jgi:amino acid transporter
MRKLLLILILLFSWLDAFARAGGHGHGWGRGPSSGAEILVIVPFAIVAFVYIWWDDRQEMAAEARDRERKLQKS